VPAWPRSPVQWSETARLTLTAFDEAVRLVPRGLQNGDGSGPERSVASPERWLDLVRAPLSALNEDAFFHSPTTGEPRHKTGPKLLRDHDL